MTTDIRNAGPSVPPQPGEANTAVPWYELVHQDEVPLAEDLREQHRYTPRSVEVPIERYTTREWHLLEKEHLWRKVWQMACRSAGRVAGQPVVGSK
jgi:hypothetical protein